MFERPQIPADLILHAVRAGTHRVTIALVHPADLVKIDIEAIRSALGANAILPSQQVERGFLYIDTKSVRRN